MNKLLLFIVLSLIAQAVYYIIKKDGWLGFTIFAEGLILGCNFGPTSKAYFWLGYILIVTGVFLFFYVIDDQNFLPEKINKILYHPKFCNPWERPWIKIKGDKNKLGL